MPDTSLYAVMHTHLVNSGLVGRRIYRPTAPERTPFPYIEMAELSPAQDLVVVGPYEKMVERVVDIDVFQKRGGTADPSYVPKIVKLFDKARLTVPLTDSASTREAFCRMSSTQYIDEQENGVIRYQLSVTVRTSSLVA